MIKRYLAAAAIICCVVIYIFWPDSYEIRNPVPKGESIVCFGDSLTYGTGAREGMGYPSQLAKMTGFEIINAGIPGDTTARALKRMDDLLAENPRIVLITLGGNDLKNGVKEDKAFDNLKSIVLQIQDRGALVILGGIDIPFRGKNFSEAYKKLARETGAVLIPDILEGIFGRPGLMSDMIHPNEKGYALMAEHFYNAVKPYL